MHVVVESSRIIKPAHNADHIRPPLTTTQHIPLSVFDKVTFDTHVAVIYAFRPPTPPNSVIEEGLAKVLAEYGEYAGRFGEDSEGNRVILLSDEGVRFVEASVDTTLSNAMPFKPSPSLLDFHPSADGVEELLLVQLTRFACGSLVLGFSLHHVISDGHATSNFLVSWGRASRGLSINPLPLHDRTSLFVPRQPPQLEFEHRGVEFKSKKSRDSNTENPLKNEVVIHKAHFTKEFLSKLKAMASAGRDQPYTTFQCMVAHLWRVVTKARGLNGCETTHVRIAVDGRRRMIPAVPDGYSGNLVLWAFPRANVRELMKRPLQYAADLIRTEVAKVEDSYFKSFIDFSSSGAAEEEGLMPTADADEMVLCPNLEVDSWTRFPFYDLDFGGGSPYYFVPSYLPVEGLLILLPSFIGDGSIDAFVPLFHHNLDSFKLCCYSMD
ncbi:agmatine coumaroyltransferase-2-like [Ananas comosus]|uniref:Agmatine coumaroyltransferase-2-like n=1 Tax=Ananas comosus TaxID=4615 RepID=A0A6P5G072_ANACO|nr:agmatine coumaroyltransferase-2-like [Ananas comosus]